MLLTVLHSDNSSLIRISGNKLWQLHWNSETQNKVHLIEPRVNCSNCSFYPTEKRLLFTD